MNLPPTCPSLWPQATCALSQDVDLAVRRRGIKSRKVAYASRWTCSAASIRSTTRIDTGYCPGLSLSADAVVHGDNSTSSLPCDIHLDFLDSPARTRIPRTRTVHQHTSPPFTFMAWPSHFLLLHTSSTFMHLRPPSSALPSPAYPSAAHLLLLHTSFPCLHPCSGWIEASCHTVHHHSFFRLER